MSFFVLILAAVLLALREWASAMMANALPIVLISSGCFISAALAKRPFALRFMLVVGGVVGLSCLILGFVVTIALQWLQSGQPLN